MTTEPSKPGFMSRNRTLIMIASLLLLLPPHAGHTARTDAPALLECGLDAPSSRAMMVSKLLIRTPPRPATARAVEANGGRLFRSASQPQTA